MKKQARAELYSEPPLLPMHAHTYTHINVQKNLRKEPCPHANTSLSLGGGV